MCVSFTISSTVYTQRSSRDGRSLDRSQPPRVGCPPRRRHLSVHVRDERVWAGHPSKATSAERSERRHSSILMMAFQPLALAAALGQMCINVNLVSAQLDTNAGFTSACPFSGFSSRVGQLNAACCVPSGDGSGGECAGSCTTDCIGTLFPLLDDCRDVMNAVYDGADGVPDGVASSVSSIEDDCNQVQPENLVDMLMTMQA